MTFCPLPVHETPIRMLRRFMGFNGKNVLQQCQCPQKKTSPIMATSWGCVCCRKTNLCFGYKITKQRFIKSPGNVKTAKLMTVDVDF